MTDLLNYTSGYKKWNSTHNPQPQEIRTWQQENLGQIPVEKEQY